MFYVLQNESVAARRRVPILLTDAATGTTAQSAVATNLIYPYVNSNGGSFSGGAGTVANSGFGQYYYEFDPSEIGTLGLAGIHVTAFGCRDYDSIVQVAAFDMYSASGAGATAYAIAQEVWNTNLTTFNDTDLAGGMQKSTYDTVSGNLDGNISGIPTAVWNRDMTDFIGLTNSAGDYLYQLGIGATGYAAGGGISAYDVWNYTLTNTQTADTTITDIQSQLTNTVPTSTAASVWSYTMTNSQLTENALIAAASGVTAGDIWEYDISAISTAGTAGSQLNLSASGGAGLSAGDVWNYVDRTITGGIADTVTSVTNPVLVDTLSMSGIANSVWSTLTAPYTTHATFGHNVLRSDNAATIGEVTLHQSGGSKRVDADVHAFVNNTASATAMLNILTGIGASITSNITGNLSGSVGSVTNPVSVTTASMTGIAGTVWSTDVSGFTSPSAGYDLTQAASGGAGLTAGDVSVAVWDSATTNHTSNGTFGYNLLRSDNAGVAGTVSLWTGGAFSGVFADVYRIDEDYNAAIALKDILTGVGSTITGNIDGNVTGSVFFVVDDVTVSAGTQASIANSIWSTDISGYTAPSAGYDLSNVSVGSAVTDAAACTIKSRLFL